MKKRIVKVNRALLKAVCEALGLTPKQAVERAIELATRPQVFVAYSYQSNHVLRTYLKAILKDAGCIYVDAYSGPRQ